jgi:hypothetical protein
MMIGGTKLSSFEIGGPKLQKVENRGTKIAIKPNNFCRENMSLKFQFQGVAIMLVTHVPKLLL